MKVEKAMNWLKSEDFQIGNPLACKVTAVEAMDNQWGNKDIVVFFELNDKQIKALTLYKNNLNQVIDAWGEETDKWINKLFMLQQEESINGKQIRRIIIR